MEILKVENLYKQYQDKLALNNITFSVNAGDIVSIVGPSGAGKSTLLKTIFNLEQASIGNIKVLDEYILKDGRYSKNKELKKVFQKMGFIFQDFNLFDNLNVYDNIALCMKIVQKRKKEDIKKNIDDLLNLVNLTGKEKSYPSQLSGGERQRVAIARALALNPKILLLDEPTSALDNENINELIKILKDLKTKKNMTMLIVTHDLSFSKMVSNRLIMIEKGNLILDNFVEMLDNIEDERIKKFLEMR